MPRLLAILRLFFVLFFALQLANTVTAAEVLDNGDIVVADFKGNFDSRGHRRPLDRKSLAERGWALKGSFDKMKVLDIKRHVVASKRASHHEDTYIFSTWAARNASLDYDTQRGELLSPEFIIDHDYITFLLSGGQYEHEACVNLIVDGVVVRTASGLETEELARVAFDVKTLRGKKARFQVLDDTDGLWGHINVGQVLMSRAHDAKRVFDALPVLTRKSVAETLSGRQEGALSLSAGQLKVGDKAIDLAEIILLKTGVGSRVAKGQTTVRFINGDVWIAEVTSLDGDALSVRHAIFGERKIALSKIASLGFNPGPISAVAPGTLVQTQGNQIPGKLIWIRKESIAIDCSLGVIPVPRKIVRGYVFAVPAETRSADMDRVVLKDGSELHGTLRVEKDRLVLQHAEQGDIDIALSGLVSVSRTPSGFAWLSELESTVVESRGPLSHPPAPSFSIEDDHKFIRMMPYTVVRYKLDEAKKNRIFRAEVKTLWGSRSEIKVSILAHGKTQWTQILVPGDKAVSVDLALADASELTIVTDFSGALSFPCGIAWRNAHILEAIKQ